MVGGATSRVWEELIFVQEWIIVQFQRFLEMAPGCIGEHLHGEELVLPEMDYNPVRRGFQSPPKNVFCCSYEPSDEGV